MFSSPIPVLFQSMNRTASIPALIYPPIFPTPYNDFLLLILRPVQPGLPRTTQHPVRKRRSTHRFDKLTALRLS